MFKLTFYRGILQNTITQCNLIKIFRERGKKTSITCTCVAYFLTLFILFQFIFIQFPKMQAKGVTPSPYFSFLKHITKTVVTRAFQS